MIAEIIKWILQIIAEWPERKRQNEDKARKKAQADYSKFRNGYELRKDRRQRRALDLLKLRDSPKGDNKLP